MGSWGIQSLVDAPSRPEPGAPDFEQDLTPKGDKPNPDGLSDGELLERIKDPRWRLRNLYYILNEDGHEVKFVPNEVQEQFFDDIWYRNVVPKARQRGFTTAGKHAGDGDGHQQGQGEIIGKKTGTTHAGLNQAKGRYMELRRRA